MDGDRVQGNPLYSTPYSKTSRRPAETNLLSPVRSELNQEKDLYSTEGPLETPRFSRLISVYLGEALSDNLLLRGAREVVEIHLGRSQTPLLVLRFEEKVIQ